MNVPAARFSGCVAVVMGASSGLGRAAALRFASEGASTVVVARRRELLDDLVLEIRRSGGDALALKADVTNEPDVVRVFDEVAARFGRLNVLFNNAGRQLVATVAETSRADWDAVFATNTRSVMLAVRQATPLMRGRVPAAIVNTASIYAFGTVSHQTAYSASKGAVVALTRALALELVDDGIRVNCVVPGWMDTDYSRRWFDEQPDPEAARRSVEAQYPMRRPAVPSEVAAAVAFLASQEASFITGEALAIDGGYLAR